MDIIRLRIQASPHHAAHLRSWNMKTYKTRWEHIISSSVEQDFAELKSQCRCERLAFIYPKHAWGTEPYQTFAQATNDNISWTHSTEETRSILRSERIKENDFALLKQQLKNGLPLRRSVEFWRVTGTSDTRVFFDAIVSASYSYG